MTTKSPTPASVSQILRRQLLDLNILFRRVNTGWTVGGRLHTMVYAHDTASVAEALRTLHPEHEVTDGGSYAALVSDGRL